MSQNIKVTCPKCKSALHVAKDTLNKTQGHVLCPECQHIFRLVKKSKPANSENTPIPTPNNPDEITIINNESTNDTPQSSSPLADSKTHITEVPDERTQAQEIKKKTLGSAPHARSNKIFTYRIPKADDLPHLIRYFTQQKDNPNLPFTFMEQTANGTLPMIPSDEDLAKTLETDNKNNITIHTDHLVFTLVNDGNSSIGKLSNYNAGHLPPPTMPQHEINWLIATIAALIVLVVQLFYFMLMLHG